MKYRVFLVVMAVFVLSLSGAAVGAESGQKWAVLVGIDEYTHLTPLRCAVNDVLRLAATFMEVCGFPRENVFVFTSEWRNSRALTDPGEFPLPLWFPDWLEKPDRNGIQHWQEPNRSNIEQCLTRLQQEVKSGDLFLFYFSGHGAEWSTEQGKRYYLGLIDVDPEEPEELPKTCLEAGELQVWIGGDPTRKEDSGIRTKNLLMILDACRDYQTGRGFGGSKDMTKDIARAFSVQPRVGQEFSATLFACKEGERSYEWGKKGHGFFTYFLLQGLRGQAADPGSGEVNHKTLENYLGEEVPKAVREMYPDREQVPYIKPAEYPMKYELLLTQLVKVRINALPWATVYVDEVQKGQTPLTLFLSAGTHAVRLEPPDSRWDRVERTLEVGPGQANSLSVSLPEGGGS